MVLRLNTSDIESGKKEIYLTNSAVTGLLTFDLVYVIKKKEDYDRQTADNLCAIWTCLSHY